MDGQGHEVHILGVFTDKWDLQSFEDHLATFLDMEMSGRGGYSFSVKPLEDDEPEAEPAIA